MKQRNKIERGVSSVVAKLARKLVGLSLVLASCLVTPALAQGIDPLDIATDPNGLDIFKGQVRTQMPELSIPAAPRLKFSHPQELQPMLTGEVVEPEGPGGFSIDPDDIPDFSNSESALWQPTSIETSSRYNVSFGRGAAGFMCEEDCVPNEADGSYIAPDYRVGLFIVYDGASGRTFRFDQQLYVSGFPGSGEEFHYYPSQVSFPDGEVHTYTYYTTTSSGFTYRRLSQISSNVGFTLKFTYENPVYGSGWNLMASAEIVANSAPAIPLAKYSYTRTQLGLQITDLLNRTIECTGCSNSNAIPAYRALVSVKLPGESQNTIVSTAAQRAYGSTTHSNFATQIVKDGVAYAYSYEVGKDPYRKPTKVTITAPEGFSRVFNISDSAYGVRPYLQSVVDSDGRQTSYQYDGALRVRKITFAEGNSVEVSYDLSGNIVERRTKPLPNSGLQDLVLTADYNDDLYCGSISCQLPNWTRDAKGKQTDYTWGPHGGMLTSLAPADSQDRRAKVKYTYSSTGPARPIREELCATDVNGNELTCGTANSFVKQTTYLGDTSLPLTETITDGVGNGPLTTTYTYDDAGRVLSQDGPLPGSDDATYYRYDVVGRKIREVGPKGENGWRPATLTSYRDVDDQVELVQAGRVPGNDPDGLFTPHSEVATNYNSNRLPIETRVKAGGSTYALTQISYDSRSRESCTAVRMNPTVFASPPADACTLGTQGADGPDRITHKTYDSEDRVLKIQRAYGTGLQQDYATYTYTADGLQETITDARGYTARMAYDDHRRQNYWYMPKEDTPGQHDPFDFEKYEYDLNGNRTALYKRDGSKIEFVYDNLNRVIKKIVPTRADLDPIYTKNVLYGYDIRGLQTSATFEDNGQGITNAYDRYGRMTTATEAMDGNSWSLDSYYDVGSNRVNLFHRWNNAMFTYTYSSGGQFNQLKDPYGNVLVDFDYNAKNELVTATRISSAPDQSFSYDPIGRLESIGYLYLGVHTPMWSYTRNAAGQIKTETLSDQSFAWTDFVSKDELYTANGQNEYTQVGTSGFCHDANGNLTADGQYVYIYDIENRLVEMRAEAGSTCTSLSSSGQLKARLRYDPMGRLHEVTNYVNGVSQGPTRFLYDGNALVAEFDGVGNVIARHVHGPAAQRMDNPLVSYESPYVALDYARMLYADPRGSIVYRSDSTNTLRHINTYDEYGQPAVSNVGRFQYTGQVWLEELGMSYYKARIYSPRIGRFLQPDPIGYVDNVNLYAYVNHDPINLVDFNGQCAGPIAVPCAIVAEKVVEALIVIGCALFCDDVIERTAPDIKVTPDEPEQRGSAPRRSGKIIDGPRGGSTSEVRKRGAPDRCIQPNCDAPHAGVTETGRCPDCETKKRNDEGRGRWEDDDNRGDEKKKRYPSRNQRR